MTAPIAGTLFGESGGIDRDGSREALAHPLLPSPPRACGTDGRARPAGRRAGAGAVLRRHAACPDGGAQHRRREFRTGRHRSGVLRHGAALPDGGAGVGGAHPCAPDRDGEPRRRDAAGGQGRGRKEKPDAGGERLAERGDRAGRRRQPDSDRGHRAGRRRQQDLHRDGDPGRAGHPGAASLRQGGRGRRKADAELDGAGLLGEFSGDGLRGGLVCRRDPSGRRIERLEHGHGDPVAAGGHRHELRVHRDLRHRRRSSRPHGRGRDHLPVAGPGAQHEPR